MILAAAVRTPPSPAPPAHDRMLARLWRLAPAALLLQVLAAHARMMPKADMQAKQAAAAQRFATLATSARAQNSTGVKNITFSNPKASGACLVFAP